MRLFECRKLNKFLETDIKYIRGISTYAMNIIGLSKLLPDKMRLKAESKKHRNWCYM